MNAELPVPHVTRPARRLSPTRSWVRLFAALSLLSLPPVQAFPPAPHHTFFGVVRDEVGDPLGTNEVMIILSGSAGEVIRTPTDSTLGPGLNYTLRVPMDSGTVARLYKPTALRPMMPFTIKVFIGNRTYVPIEVLGRDFVIGQPGERTRLDLTLGLDSDGDGLPDAWEMNVIDGDPNDGLRNLADVRPGDDADGDGLTNLQEYLAGTYALDRLDGVNLEIVDLVDGFARLKFLAITGRTYRIRSSTDLRTWTNQQFTFAPNAPLQSHFRASDVRMAEVLVPWTTEGQGFFQLFAE